MNGHRCNNVCARSHRLSRPQATPYVESSREVAEETLGDLVKAFGVLVLLFVACWVYFAIAVAVQS